MPLFSNMPTHRGRWAAVLPSSDKTEAVCLWEAGSVDAVQEYLDSLTGEASENAYFQVSTERAIGIPEPIAAVS
jgi:hypothetical protein